MKQQEKKIPFPFIFLAVYLVAIVAAFIVSFKVLGIPIAAVGLFIVLEGTLAALLNRIPLWIHGLVFVGQIVAGVFFHKLIFMVLMAVVYALCVALLFFFTRNYD